MVLKRKTTNFWRFMNWKRMAIIYHTFVGCYKEVVMEDGEKKIFYVLEVFPH